MNTTNTASTFEPDDLPNDLAWLKDRIVRQNALLGSQLVELDILRDEIRHLKRKNQMFRQLLWTPN